VSLDARVPSERARERHAVFNSRAAHGVPYPPAGTFLQHQLLRGRRKSVGPKRRQVLIREGESDQGVVGHVRSSRERAEGGRYSAGLDVDVARRPWTNPHVERVRPDRAEVLRLDIAQDRHVIVRLHEGGHAHAKHSERRVPVVGVVEEPGIVRSVRRGHIAADRDVAIGHADRPRRQRAPRLGALRGSRFYAGGAARSGDNQAPARSRKASGAPGLHHVVKL